MCAAPCVGILAMKFKDDLPEAQNKPLQAQLKMMRPHPDKTQI